MCYHWQAGLFIGCAASGFEVRAVKCQVRWLRKIDKQPLLSIQRDFFGQAESDKAAQCCVWLNRH